MDMETCNTNGTFENVHGKIETGTLVKFQVENQDQWNGDLQGRLIYTDGKFKVETERSGVLPINHGYDVYYNSIEPIST